MPKVKKPRKADLDRLQALLGKWAKGEARMQEQYGDAVPHSWRAGMVKDAAALRRLLEHVGVASGAAGVKSLHGAEAGRAAAQRLLADPATRQIMQNLKDGGGVKACETEQDCTQEPWCRINGKCQRAVDVKVDALTFDAPSEWKRRALAAEAALRDIADDYADRFDLDSPSTNPGMKSVVKQARAVLDAAGVKACAQAGCQNPAVPLFKFCSQHCVEAAHNNGMDLS